MNSPKILLVGENSGNSRKLASFLAGLDMDVERSAVLPEPSMVSGGTDRIALIILEAAEPTEEQAERVRTIVAADPRPAVVALSAVSR